MSSAYPSILLFGPPGAGKGTQGQRLGALEHCVHLATGDMFRGLDPRSELGEEVASYSSKGELVPDELTVRLWAAHVQGLIDQGAYDPAADLLLLDGIPRSLAQARALDDRIEPLAILHLVVGDLDAMVERMRGRALTQARADDADEAVIRKRFEVYDQQTAPVLGHYDSTLIHAINAEESIEQVFEAARAVLESLRS